MMTAALLGEVQPEGSSASLVRSRDWYCGELCYLRETEFPVACDDLARDARVAGPAASGGGDLEFCVCIPGCNAVSDSWRSLVQASCVNLVG